MRLFLALCPLLLLAAGATAPPGTPVITEPAADGQIVNPADLHMEAWSYVDPEGNPHASSDIEVWKVAAPEKIWDAPAIAGIEKNHLHLGDGTFVGSYAGRRDLEYDTDYRVKFRFRDSTGEVSPWAERLVRTSTAGPPGVSGPVPYIAALGYAVEVVAEGFEMPVNIAFVPNPGPNPTDPMFYVTELYGTIKVVLRNGTVGTYAGASALGPPSPNPASLINFNPTGLFPGSGEQGLAGICVDPATGDVFVSLLYADPAPGGPHYPKIVRLSSTDGGRTASAMTLVLQMPGEIQGQSHFISNLSIGPDGKLYVHNGDGFDYTTAQNLNSYRGKILRMNMNGTAATDNPFYDAANGINARDYVWASGLRNPFGGAWRASDGSHYEVENGPNVDRFAKVVAGRNLLWDNTDASMANFAIHNWSPAHGPVNVAFVQSSTFTGSGFPAEKMDHAFVTESGPTYGLGPQANGKRIVEFVLDGAGNKVSGPTTLIEYVGTGRGSAVGLACGPDGLYFTELYKDQNATSPIQAGARVFRVRYVGTPPATGSGLVGTYYSGIDFNFPLLTRTDATVDFQWGNIAPAAGVPVDNYSVRWTGFVTPVSSETYTFTTNSDDGVRLWVNGQQIVNNWTDHGATENSGQMVLQAGQAYSIQMEYYEKTVNAVAQLFWSTPTLAKQIIPQTQLSAAVPLPPSVVAAPTFSPTPGAFTNPISVAIATTTAGASIRYTTDGSAPSSSAGTLYTTPVPITTTTTFRAIAFKSGMTDSSVTNATYTSSPAGSGTGLTGDYYTGVNFNTFAFTRVDPTIDFFAWSEDPPMAPGFPVDFYSVRWTGKVLPQSTETYTFYLTTDDGGRLWVNNQLIVDKWIDQGFVEWTGTIALVAGQQADIKIEYYEKNGSSGTRLAWSSPSTAKAVVPQARLFPANAPPPAVAAPAFTPAPGPFPSPMSVTISSTTAGASIRYTTDGSTPTSTTGTPYSAAIPIGATTTFRAIAYMAGMTDSTVTTATYTYSPGVVANPTYSPAPGTFASPMSVTISSATAGAAIRYTTDGSAPTSTTGTLYSGPVAITATTAFRAIAYAAGMVDSAVTTATYTYSPGVVANPAYSPAPGTFSSPMPVTISSATADASIRYTTDGTAPTSTTGTLYSGPVAITATTAFRAIAFKPGMLDSAVVNGTYTFVSPVVAAPTFSPVPGTFSGPLSVTISSTTAGAIIRYTTDGTTPSSTIGTPYTAPVAISVTTTFKAIAYSAGMTDSTVTTATYTYSPAGSGTGLTGDYYTGRNFNTFSFTRIDPTIDFVLWNPDTSAPGFPADQFSIRWTGKVLPLFTQTYTFYLATDDGGRLWVNNQLIIDKWVDQSFVENSGTIALVAGQQVDVKVEFYEKNGRAAALFSWSSPSTPKQVVPQTSLYPVNAPPPGVAAPAFSPTPGPFSSPMSVTISSATPGASIHYTTDGTAPTSTTGTLYSAPVPISATTNFRAIATMTGMTDSAVVNAAYTFVAPVVANPTYSPAPGTFASPMSVTLSTPTAGASLRYTTDGSTPTPSAGILYSAPVPISATTTFRAIAYASGMTDSAVTLATYTYTPGTVASPTYSPTPGTFSSPMSVTISSSTAGASVRYTTDGTAPTSTTGILYSVPLPISATTNFRAIAYKSGMLDSAVVNASYTYSPSGTGTGLTGDYYTGVNFNAFAFTRVDPTIDFFAWSEDPPMAPGFPVDFYSIRWTGKVLPQSTETYTFYLTTDDGGRLWVNNQLIVDKWIDQAPTESSGTIALVAGQQADIKIEYYEKNGGSTARLAWSSPSTPKAVVPQIALFPVNAPPPGVAAPAFTPAPGPFSSPMSVTISSATPGASLHYTTDGTAPTSTTGTLYSAPVPISATTNFRAIATKTGMTDSAVVNAAYTFVAPVVANPTYSPAPGTFASPMSVTISTPTAGASLRYTTDGSTPTPSAGLLYSAPVPISATTTFRAIAYASGMTDSAVTLATYTYTPGTVASPTYSPTPGTFSSPMSVTISSSTAGASVRYTTDGTAPTSTTGILYSAPVPISASTNFRAIAYKSGMLDSAVVNASYTYSPSGTGSGLTGDYYTGMNFNTFAFTRVDPTIDFFAWSEDPPMAPGFPVDFYSIRWTGKVLPQSTETYTFYLTTDDGGRLWVNNQLIVDKWIDQAPTESSGTIALVAGQQADIKIEYYEKNGGSTARLAWSSPSTPKAVVPQIALFPSGGALPKSAVANGDTLQSLLDGAQAGETVSLGLGSFTVPSGGLFVPAGVSLKGAGPGNTVLDGAGAPAVLRLMGGPVTIEGMTLSGGVVGLNTGTADAVLAHLVVARNSGDGVVVEAGGTVDARYLTVADNGGNGFSSTGTALLNHSIVAGNVGAGVVGATVTSSSVDLPVAFVDAAALDYRVVGGSTLGAYAEDPQKSASSAAMPGDTGGGGCGAIGLEGFLLVGLLISLKRRR